MSIQVAASILSANFSQLGAEVVNVTKAGADYIHIDVMDGRFVPNITIGPAVIAAIRPYTQLPFDVHLMIESPSSHIKDFVDSGADIITVHAEAEVHLERTIRQIKNYGKKAGVSLVPTTLPSALEYIIHELDLVLVMSVNPGFGGQEFLVSQLQKISYLKQMINHHSSSAKIEVDGGINAKNAQHAADAGAEILVTGSFIFKADNLEDPIKQLKHIKGRND